MVLRGRRFGGILWLVAASSVAMGAAPAAGPGLSALGQIQPGQWQLRQDDGTAQKVCVSDPYSLMQLRHRASSCARLVIANEATTATIHYSCPGRGWGRTTLKVSTPRFVEIDTQGIADNAPFAFAAEARRTGDCPAPPRH